MIQTKLHILMAKHRINMKELHEQTGIRAATISGYYHDNYKHMSKEHMDILCKFFNAPITDLLEYVPDK